MGPFNVLILGLNNSMSRRTNKLGPKKLEKKYLKEKGDSTAQITLVTQIAHGSYAKSQGP